MGHIAAIARLLPAIAILTGSTIAAADSIEATSGKKTYIGTTVDYGIRSFAGVPYAQPPVGDYRWRPPRPEPAGEASVDATRFPDVCVQADGNVAWYQRVAKAFGHPPDVVHDKPAMSEDCLYLNIWTPTTDANADLPVMVWIHGGSNVNGWSYEPNYRGTQLARRGVVVVSIQYRMGVFGFLAHPELTAESRHDSSGNYGILDQIESLRWIKRHITDFGGDPDNVTVFGESAGAGNIAYLMLSPLAADLFDRAISQSGGWPRDHDVHLGESETIGEKFVDKLDAVSIDALREKDAEWILQSAQEHYDSEYDDPPIDGWLLPSAPRVLLEQGNFPKRDLIIGTNRDEWLMYQPDDVTMSDFEAAVAEVAGKEADARRIRSYLGNLPLRTKMDRLRTAGQMLCPSISIAAAVAKTGGSAYVYRFDRVREGNHGLGAYHGAEIPYIFNTHDAWLPTTDIDIQLTDHMMSYWVRFAESGNLKPFWPHLDDSMRQMVFTNTGPRPATIDVPMCDWLDRDYDFEIP